MIRAFYLYGNSLHEKYKFLSKKCNLLSVRFKLPSEDYK